MKGTVFSRFFRVFYKSENMSHFVVLVIIYESSIKAVALVELPHFSATNLTLRSSEIGKLRKSLKNGKFNPWR